MLQAFGDASQSAYGACVYLHVQLKDEQWKSSLVMARAKVAPLKRQSLPRLELLGALLCARLVVYAKEALKLPEHVICQCWTDSTVVLAWIQSDPMKWKPFVGNRVAEIQSLTSPSQWNHLPGKENAADLVTRGISAEELLNSQIWLQGPGFLSSKVDHTSGSERLLDDGELDESHSGAISSEQYRRSNISNHLLISVALDEGKSPDKGVHEVSTERNAVLDIRRWSSLVRAMRVMGWVQRFLYNTRVSKEMRLQGDLSFPELSEAKLRLLQYVQKQEFKKEIHALQSDGPVPRGSSILKLSPFVGKDGLLRVQGRLQFSGLPYESQHPVIIPKGHFGLLLARQVHVNLKHAGVNNMLVELRNQYWIVGARRLCKKVKRECTPCQRLDAPPGTQTMAPLPELRVKQAPPFSVTGLDHGGPLYCCDFVGKKFYVLLFTCAVTRAIHLELVDSLSCDTTVMALRRFIARRGMPSVLMSDNAKGFLAAKDSLLKVFGSEGPDWKFIAPRAPWWGGWWERLVGTIKSALKRSIGKRSLTRVELETTLHEVEACVNSRPLTFVGDEIDSGAPLTPSHFLLGRSPGCKSIITPEDTPVIAHDLVLRQELRRQLLDKFWSCWVNEYIRSLPPCKGVPVNKGGVHVGSVVLIKGLGSSRLQWPLGIVQVIHPGRDGLVRTVEVKTAKGRFTRPIQCVHNLEITEGPSVPSQDCEQSPDTHIQTKTPSLNVNPGSDTRDSHASDNLDDTLYPDTVVQRNDSNNVSRYGRRVKKPLKLDL